MWRERRWSRMESPTMTTTDVDDNDRCRQQHCRLPASSMMTTVAVVDSMSNKSASIISSERTFRSFAGVPTMLGLRESFVCHPPRALYTPPPSFTCTPLSVGAHCPGGPCLSIGLPYRVRIVDRRYARCQLFAR